MRNYWKHHEICISRLGTAYAHPMHCWSVASPSGHFLKDIFGKFDGYLSPSQNLKFADVPSGLAAISKVPLEGWLQVLLVAGLIETQLFKDSLGPSSVVCWIQLKDGNNDGRWWQSDNHEEGREHTFISSEAFALKLNSIETTEWEIVFLEMTHWFSPNIFVFFAGSISWRICIWQVWGARKLWHRLLGQKDSGWDNGIKKLVASLGYIGDYCKVYYPVMWGFY